MAENRMAGELFQLLSPYNHINVIAHLSNKDVFAQKHFVHHWLNKSYWMDTRKCYNQCHKNSQQIFEIFGAFNDEGPSQVRENVVKLIQQEKDIYSSVGQHHLRRCKLSIDEWIMLMSSDSVFGDELMLYALSHIYQRHVVIFTAHGYWTTVGSDEPLSPLRLLDICEVKLMFIGMHMYSELKLKPFVPVHLRAITESPCGNIPRPTESDTNIENAVDLTTSTSSQPPVIMTDDDATDGSDFDTLNGSDTVMDNISPSGSMNDYSSQTSPDPSELSDTPSESLLTPLKVSSELYTPGINDDINNSSFEDAASYNAEMGTNVIAENTDPFENSAMIYNAEMGINIITKNTDPCENSAVINNAEMGINVISENTDPCDNKAVMGKNVKKSAHTNPKMLSTEIDIGVLGINPNLVPSAMGKNVEKNRNAEMVTNVMERNIDLCENSAAMGKNVINMNAQMSNVVLGVNPDLVMPIRDLPPKKIEYVELGINVIEEKNNACNISAAMGKNVINIENNAITDATNITLDAEQSVCSQKTLCIVMLEDRQVTLT